MNHYLICAGIFLATYTVCMLYITVFYHRALTHRSVTLSPQVRTFVVRTGMWVTGMDAKSWCCMHRLHHRYSDTVDDPHSPENVGLVGVLKAQLRSYGEIQSKLLLQDPALTDIVRDLDFPVSWVIRRQLWYLPSLLHAVFALVLTSLTGTWLVGAAYWVGIMSHPIQGWMVNALAHRYGYRNFDTGDASRNNLFVAWLVMGEGYQNNHHRHPSDPRFSWRWWEIDPGYGLCLLANWLGIVAMNNSRWRRPRLFEPRGSPVSGRLSQDT